MTILSDDHIAQLALDAGWSGTGITIATAIALAESGGNPRAIGDRSLVTAIWGPSVGLWQIRSLQSQLHTGGVRDESVNLDAEVNAHHAYIIFRWAGGFSPWSTYNNNRYRQFWARALAATEHITHGRVLHRYLLELRTYQRGSDVAACQRIVGCAADGVFGPITKGHVRSWQKREHLLVDGIVGPQTAHSFGWMWAGPTHG